MHTERTQPNIAHYASAAGGRRAYGAGSGFLTIATQAEAAFCAITNPTGSGVDIYFDVGEFAANQNTEFRRYVGGTLSGLGTPVTNRNTGGGTGTGTLQFYVPGQYTASGGTIGKVAFVQAYATYFTNLNGRLILRPGRSVYWTIDGSQNNVRGSVYLEWYELGADAS